MIETTTTSTPKTSESCQRTYLTLLHLGVVARNNFMNPYVPRAYLQEWASTTECDEDAWTRGVALSEMREQVFRTVSPVVAARVMRDDDATSLSDKYNVNACVVVLQKPQQFWLIKALTWKNRFAYAFGF